LRANGDDYFLSMKTIILLLTMTVCGLSVAGAEDITTLDGHTYENIKDVTVKHNGLFFVHGVGNDMHGVTLAYTNLSADVQEKYHCDPFERGMAYARLNVPVALNKNMAFSLDTLEAAKKKAKAEKKMIGFIMEWDSMLVTAPPLEQGSECGLAHFYDVFHEGLVLVFVRHENQLGLVPPAVQQGFGGPEEGGFAPNMAVVTADCSKFVCEIPYGGDKSNGGIREQIFREKIAVMKKFSQAQASGN
jgi:hypothetical protein